MPVLVAVVALYVLFMALLPTPSWWRGFCVGVLVGSLAVAVTWLIHLFSGSSNALFGTLGETATAEELQSRRMKRSGWHLVNGLTFAGHGDVDHSLVGPGGIFAVESKWTNQEWEIGSPRRSRALSDALVQARLGASKIASTLRAHHLASDHTVHPVVVIWGPGAPIIPGGRINLDGVEVVEGRHLRSWARSLGELEMSRNECNDVNLALRKELGGRSEPGGTRGVSARI